MGYRTDGIWLIRGTVEDITAAMVSARMNHPSPAKEMDMDFSIFDVYEAGYENKIVGYIKLEFEGWKWYSSYTDIQWLERLWAHWSECTGLSGTRLHVGEEETDVEIDRFGDDPTDVYINRSIGVGEATVGNQLFNKEQTCN
jgi:hypothetical protein